MMASNLPVRGADVMIDPVCGMTVGSTDGSRILCVSRARPISSAASLVCTNFRADPHAIWSRVPPKKRCLPHSGTSWNEVCLSPCARKCWRSRSLVPEMRHGLGAGFRTAAADQD